MPRILASIGTLRRAFAPALSAGGLAYLAGLLVGVVPICSAAQSNETSALAFSNDPTPLEMHQEIERPSRFLDLSAAKDRLDAQVSRMGGYPAWTASLSSWREEAGQLISLEDQIAIVGLDKHLFTRGGVEYVLDDSLVYMPTAERAFDVICAFHKLLQSRGVDLILVPVPSREEVYPDKLSAACPSHLMVSPQSTQFLQALLDVDVEVVDLREAFLDEREKHDELLYPIAEIHWGTYGIRRAAAEIAPRLQRYTSTSSEKRVVYLEKLTRITREGALVPYLPAEAKAEYPAAEWDVIQVLNPDESQYQDTEQSPVVVVGDSFTMRYINQAGHLSAHIAKELGFPVSTLSKKGDGPQSLRMLTVKDPKNLASRRVAVWVISSICLGDRYADQWHMPRPLP